MRQLRSLRLQHQFTLHEVGKQVGCTAGNLSRVERGLQAISLPLAVRLACLYGVSVDDLIKS